MTLSLQPNVSKFDGIRDQALNDMFAFPYATVWQDSQYMIKYVGPTDGRKFIQTEISDKSRSEVDVIGRLVSERFPKDFSSAILPVDEDKWKQDYIGYQGKWKIQVVLAKSAVIEAFSLLKSLIETDIEMDRVLRGPTEGDRKANLENKEFKKEFKQE